MPGEMVPRTPGFSIHYVEWRDATGRYHDLYLHIPDGIVGERERNAWIRSTGSISPGGGIVYSSRRDCQDHMFPCRARDHTLPEWEPPTHRLAPNEMAFNPTWEDFIRDNPPPVQEWERDLIGPDLNDIVGACGIEGCDCTNDVPDESDLPYIPGIDPVTGRVTP